MLVKVGVNFPVSEPSLSMCLRINKELQEIASSDVRFSREANSSPHVTIAMGELEEYDLPAFAAAVEAEVRQLPPKIEIAFGTPYRETTTGRYVFLDVELPAAVAAWRLQLAEALDAFFLEPARTSTVPHLTLGHVTEHQAAVDEYLRGQAAVFPTCTAYAVDISFAGPKGAKLDIFRRLPLEQQ